MKRSTLSFVSMIMALFLALPVYAKDNKDKPNFSAFSRSMGKAQVSLARYDNDKDDGKKDDHEDNNNDRFDDRFFGFKNMFGVLASVDLQAKTLLVSHGNRGLSTRTVKADGALVLSITADNAKVVTLADLKVGQRASFLLRKQRGTQNNLQAVLITQFSFPTPAPQPQPLPKMQFSTTSSASAESAASVNVPVVLSASSREDVKVMYTATGTAIGGGVDYTLASGEFTIPAGQTSGHLSLNLTDDQLDELDETVVLTLSGAVNGSLGSTLLYTHTILDND